MSKHDLYLRKEFVEWLNTECDLTSGNSYASYISTFIKKHPDLFLEEAQCEALIDNGDIEELEELFDQIYTFINYEKRKNLDDKELKALRDSGSAFKKYHQFLSEFMIESPLVADSIMNLTEIPTENFIQSPLSPLQNVKCIYLETDDIEKNFINRLMTQDRFYGDVFFPISILKKIFLKNGFRNEFNQWLSHHLNKITFYAGDKTLFLKEIKSLKIENDGAVIIESTDGSLNVLHTKIASNNSSTPMYVSAFSQIVIDHIVSMKDILSKNKSNLPALEALTKELKNIWKKDFLKRNDLREAGNKLLKSKSFEPQEIQYLIADLNLISTHTELQIMERKQNSIKRAK